MNIGSSKESWQQFIPLKKERESHKRTRHVFEDAEQATRDELERIRTLRQAGFNDVSYGSYLKLPESGELPLEQKVAQNLNLKRDWAFWESILESPAEMGHYQVYADWLIEQSKPLGEYIQQSILSNDFGLGESDRCAADRKSHRILNENHTNWFGYMVRSELKPKYFCGLPTSVELLYPNALVLHRLKNSPFCPLLQELKFMGFAENEIEYSNGLDSYPVGQLGLSPLRGGDFRDVRKLICTPSRCNMNRDSFEFISGLKSLESLELRTRLSKDSLEWLFNCSNLKELVIVSEIGDEGARVLAESRLFKQIHSLELLCFMTDIGARSISENVDPNTLKHLDVIGNRLTQTGINLLKRTGISSLETIGQTRDH